MKLYDVLCISQKHVRTFVLQFTLALQFFLRKQEEEGEWVRTQGKICEEPKKL